MTRKLIQVGGSLAVTLPAKLVKEFLLKKGDPVYVCVGTSGNRSVTIRFGIRYYEDGKVTQRFRKKADEVLRKHHALFRDLAKR